MRTAEDLFREFERKVLAANSFAVRFSVDATEKQSKEMDATPAFEGEIRVQSGKRSLFKLRRQGEEKCWEASDPATGRFLAGAFVRGGASLLPTPPTDPEERFRLSDFRLHEGGRVEVKVVSYSLAIAGERKASVSLWLEGAKIVPVQRNVRLDSGEWFMEHYEDFSIE